MAGIADQKHMRDHTDATCITFCFLNDCRGAFVMEYCGEVISPVQFEERKKQYTLEKRRHYYFMSLRTDEVCVCVCVCVCV